MGACADAGHALVHCRRRVRHRAHDGDAVGDPLLDVRRRDGGSDRDNGLPCSQMGADLGEQGVDVLRLDGDDDEPGGGDRGRVVRGCLDAVALVQLGDPLRAAVGDNDLGSLAPAGTEQAGEEGLPDPPSTEDRNLLVHAGSLGRAGCGQRDQAAAVAGEEIHAREARPLSVWLEQLAVSQVSTVRRPLSLRTSLTSPRSPTSPCS